jgi:hypothetical protein
MIKTFTPVSNFTVKTEKEKAEVQLPDTDSPSENVINSILNYSRNLEVKRSGFVENVEFIRS